MISFTVIMSIYKNDNSALVSRALDSCEANLNKPFEYLLYIDGPIAKDIESVVDDFCVHHNVRVFRSAHNHGLARALNTLLAEVRTPWFARMDADDVNVAGRFDLQCEFIAENPEVAVLGGQILEIDTDGKSHGNYKNVPLIHSEIKKYARHRNPINHMTVMANTEIVRANKGYPEIPFAEDYGLWSKLICFGAIFHNLPEVLVHASVNPHFYKRRGGMRYIYAQIKLQRHLLRCGIISRVTLVLNCIARCMVFALPSYLRGALYQLLLRRQNHHDT